MSEPCSAPAGTGFLLATIGAHAAASFAQQVAPLGISPAHVGVLRVVAEHPGRSQQAVADEFGLPASRMVTLVDDLEQRGLLERRRGAGDRRVHSLHLTADGEDMVERLTDASGDAERRLLSALSDGEREQLRELLQRVAADQGLRNGGRPGYSRLRPLTEQDLPCP